jgi:hypothetical protein
VSLENQFERSSVQIHASANARPYEGSQLWHHLQKSTTSPLSAHHECDGEGNSSSPPDLSGFTSELENLHWNRLVGSLAPTAGYSEAPDARELRGAARATTIQAFRVCSDDRGRRVPRFSACYTVQGGHNVRAANLIRPPFSQPRQNRVSRPTSWDEQAAWRPPLAGRHCCTEHCRGTKQPRPCFTLGSC